MDYLCCKFVYCYYLSKTISVNGTILQNHLSAKKVKPSKNGNVIIVSKKGFMTNSIESPASKNSQTKLRQCFFEKKTVFGPSVESYHWNLWRIFVRVFFFKLNFDLNRRRSWRQNKGHDLYHACTLFTSVFSLFLV